jgi:hypothetical protein
VRSGTRLLSGAISGAGETASQIYQRGKEFFTPKGLAAAAPSIAAQTAAGVVAPHLYPHLEGGRVFPITFNVGDVLEGYETLKKLATSINHIVPGHDPAVLDRYPAAKGGLEGWVVRLDAEPKLAA